MAILKNKRVYSVEQKDALWDRYFRDKSDVEAFNGLLEAYISLVEVIASSMKSKLPAQVEIGDLLNDGFFGLVDAVEKFDPERGWKFETYASNRIRGEISDRLRDYDWVSRYSRLKFKNLQVTFDDMVQELGREPSNVEVADRLGWTVDEVAKVHAQFYASHSINIDEYMAESNHEFFSLEELLPDHSSSDIGFNHDVSELGLLLEEKMFSLEEHESIVLFLFVYENFSFEAIGEMLNVKPAKISKIYDDAIDRLRQEFRVL
jgi:RNA polymerase sigma factor for flagellar operon FliA